MVSRITKPCAVVKLGQYRIGLMRHGLTTALPDKKLADLLVVLVAPVSSDQVPRYRRPHKADLAASHPPFILTEEPG